MPNKIQFRGTQYASDFEDFDIDPKASTDLDKRLKKPKKKTEPSTEDELRRWKKMRDEAIE